MKTEIIERAVAALDTTDNDWSHDGRAGRVAESTIKLQVIRAVLTALREPTDAMIDAGANAREKLLAGLAPAERKGIVISPYPSGTMWVAMVDAALEELA